MLADAHRPSLSNACACETAPVACPPGGLTPPGPACHLLELRQAQARASLAPLQDGCAMASDATPRTRPPGLRTAPARPGRAGCANAGRPGRRRASAASRTAHNLAGQGADARRCGAKAPARVQALRQPQRQELEVARPALRAAALLRGLNGRLRGAAPHTPAPRAPGAVRPSIPRLILADQYRLTVAQSMLITRLDTRCRSYT